jgi:hypothetical protein
MKKDDIELNASRGHDGLWIVVDSRGGVWVPNYDAQVEIECSDEPNEYAEHLCRTRPMDGKWGQ